MRNTLHNLLFLPLLLSLLVMCSLIGIVPMALAASQTPADNIEIGPASITYHARAGDTLTSIAQHLTTRAENWTALAKLNHINQDSNIPVGTAIVIPADLLIDEPSEAEVVALSGHITALAADGQTIVVKIGTRLVEGAQIETGANGFLTMALPDASRISLPSNSRVKFSKLRMARFTKSPRTELMLLHGHVESRVSPLDGNKGSYEVRTPLSVAGVRGTQFRVGIEGDSVVNEVLSGTVAVSKTGQTGEVSLDAGKGNVVNTKTVGAAVNLLPAPQLDSLSNIGNTPQITLTAVEGAIAYHVQVANDPDAQNVLLEGRANDTRVKLFGLQNGHYFVRMSAIDKHGLEGLARIQAVSFAGDSTTPANGNFGASGAPFVDGSDDKQITLRWHAKASKEFIVQVARDAEFTWLIFNTSTSGDMVTHLPRPPFGTYYARVQSINADGSANAYSPSQTFIVTDHWVINDGGAGGKKQIPKTNP